MVITVGTCQRNQHSQRIDQRYPPSLETSTKPRGVAHRIDSSRNWCFVDGGIEYMRGMGLVMEKSERTACPWSWLHFFSFPGMVQGSFITKYLYLLCWWETEVFFLVSWTWSGFCIPSNYSWFSTIFPWIDRGFSHFGKMGEKLSTSPHPRPQQLPPTPFAGASSGRRRTRGVLGLS